MRTQKIYIEFSTAPIAGKYFVNLGGNAIANAKKIKIHNCSLVTQADAYFIKVKSDGLARLRRDYYSQTNSELDNSVYTLYPETRFVRVENQTSNISVGNAALLALNPVPSFIIDFSNWASLLQPNYTNVSAIDDYVKVIQNTGADSAKIWYANGDVNIKLVAFGPASAPSNSYGVTGSASWAYAVDGTDELLCFNSVQSEWTFYLMFKASGSNFNILWDSKLLKIYEYNGVINTKGGNLSNGAYEPLTNLLIAPNHNHLLTVESKQIGGVWTRTFTLDNLTTSNTYTEDWVSTVVISPSQQSNLSLSTAQTHFGHVLSHVVFYPSINVANNVVIRNWFLSKYNGTIQQTQEVTNYQYINTDSQTYNTRKISAPIHELDFQFVNQNGTIEVSHASLEISVEFED